MIRIIHTCDKCREHNKPHDLNEIKIMHRRLGAINTYGSGFCTDYTLHLCNPCLKTFGIKDYQERKEPEYVPRTAEDVLVELLKLVGIHPNDQNPE